MAEQIPTPEQLSQERNQLVLPTAAEGLNSYLLLYDINMGDVSSTPTGRLEVAPVIAEYIVESAGEGVHLSPSKIVRAIERGRRIHATDKRRWQALRATSKTTIALASGYVPELDVAQTLEKELGNLDVTDTVQEIIFALGTLDSVKETALERQRIMQATVEQSAS